jgi:hypothetical protein
LFNEAALPPFILENRGNKSSKEELMYVNLKGSLKWIGFQLAYICISTNISNID